MPVLTVAVGVVPVGSYVGTFVGVEEVPAKPDSQYGPGLRFKFAIESGPYAGQIVSRVTGTTPSVKNACGGILSGLLGRPAKEGEQIDTAKYVGRRYMLVVADGKEGGTRVEAIMPLPEA
jgi:hypothetical protein